MKEKYSSIMFMVFAFVVLINSQVLCQDEKHILENKKITIHRENESLGTILKDLMVEDGVPIGFEKSTLDFEDSDLSFDVNTPFIDENCYVYSSNKGKIKCEQKEFKARKLKFTVIAEDEPLPVVLDSIVLQMRYYKWEINDGVVNIFPTIGRDKQFEDMLNVKIRRFTNKNVFGLESRKISDIRTSLFSLPEICNFLKDNNLRFSSNNILSPNNERELSANLFFSDITLRELLNRISKDKQGGWILKRNELIKNSSYKFVDIEI